MAKVGRQFVEQAVSRDDVAVAVSFDHVVNRLDGLLQHLLLLQRCVSVAADLLRFGFGGRDDFSRIAGCLNQQGFSLFEKFLRAMLALPPFFRGCLPRLLHQRLRFSAQRVRLRKRIREGGTDFRLRLLEARERA